MRWVLVVTVAAACYSPQTKPACEVRCTVNPADPSDRGPCPSGLACEADGLCHAADGTCSGGDDAMPAVDGNPGDGPVMSVCPIGMTLLYEEKFDNGLVDWFVVTPANGTATTVTSGPKPPAARVTRTTLDGTMMIRNAVFSAVTNRIFIQFDVTLDGTAPPNDIVFAQLETGPPRTLVRLSAQNNQVTLEEATATSGAQSIGVAQAQPVGWVTGTIDATFAPTRNLSITFGGMTQTFTNFVLQPTGNLQGLFGVFVESAGVPGTPFIDIDNIVVCVK